MKKILTKTILSLVLALALVVPSMAMAKEEEKATTPVIKTEDNKKETEAKEEPKEEPEKDQDDKKVTGKYPVIKVTKIILNEKHIDSQDEIDRIMEDLQLKWNIGDKVSSKISKSEFEIYNLDLDKVKSQKIDFVIENKYYDYVWGSLNQGPVVGVQDGKEFSTTIYSKENTMVLQIHRDTLNLTVKAKGPEVPLSKLKAKLNGKEIEFNEIYPIFVGTENELDFEGIDELFRVYKDDKPVKLPMKFTMADNYIWDFELKPMRSVKRLSGENRFLTALDTAKELYEEPETVIIANARDGSVDALSAGPLAKALNAPMLLVETESIEEDVLKYIRNDKLKKVVFVGGNGSISEKLRDKITEDLDVKVERLYGKNRYETSLEIVKELVSSQGFNKEVILVNGENNADALSATPYAVMKKYPILVVSNSMDMDKVKNYLDGLGISKSMVIGGSRSVEDATIEKLDLSNELRIKGENRYITSQNVAKHLMKEKNYVNGLILANGKNESSIDALTASTLLNKVNSPILLVKGEEYSDNLKSFVDEMKLDPFVAYIVGGDSSIDMEIENNIGY